MNLSVAKKMDRVFYADTHAHTEYIALPTFHMYIIYE